jgi:hypothetical protein
MGLQELNLNESTEELLSAERAFTYADLYATIGNKDTVAWLTPHTAVVRSGGRAAYGWNHLDETRRCFSFTADGKDIVAAARSQEHLRFCSSIVGSERRSFSTILFRCIVQCSLFGVSDGAVPKPKGFRIELSRNG